MSGQQLDPVKVEAVVDALICDLSIEDVHKMADLYARGYSTYGIGHRMGVNHQTARRILLAVGVTLRRPGGPTVLTPEIRAAAKERLARGLSARATAIAVGVAPSVIQNAVKEKTL